MERSMLMIVVTITLLPSYTVNWEILYKLNLVLGSAKYSCFTAFYLSHVNMCANYIMHTFIIDHNFSPQHLQSVGGINS